MFQSSDHTALLVFARSARKEIEAKAFSHGLGRRSNRKIVRLLNRQILRASRQSGIPTFLFTERQQLGQSFGEKLGHAFEQLYAKGYQSVIAVGNDCPAITGKLLSKVKRQLNQHQLVLGPTIQGGVYLIGMHRHVYCAKSFLKLSWQSEQLFADLLNYGQQKIPSFLCLKTEREVNNPQDLLDLLGELTDSSSLKSALLAILNPRIKSIIFQLISFKQDLLRQQISLRAPPSVQVRVV